MESIFADNTRVQIREGNNTLTLEPGQITLDNIVISGNVLEATRSDIALNSAGNIVFQGNVTAPNVTTSGNFVIDGAINTIGDAPN